MSYDVVVINVDQKKDSTIVYEYLVKKAVDDVEIDKVLSKHTLIFILILLALFLLTPKGVEAANISSEFLKDYNSLLEESMNTLKAKNYSESKVKLDQATLLH